MTLSCVMRKFTQFLTSFSCYVEIRGIYTKCLNSYVTTVQDNQCAEIIVGVWHCFKHILLSCPEVWNGKFGLLHFQSPLLLSVFLLLDCCKMYLCMYILYVYVFDSLYLLKPMRIGTSLCVSELLASMCMNICIWPFLLCCVCMKINTVG